MWFVEVKLSCNESHEKFKLCFVKSLLAFSVELCPIVPHKNLLIYICISGVKLKVIAASSYVWIIHRLKLIHLYASCSESKLWLLAIPESVGVARPLLYRQAQKVSRRWAVAVEKSCIAATIKNPVKFEACAVIWRFCD